MASGDRRLVRQPAIGDLGLVGGRGVPMVAEGLSCLTALPRSGAVVARATTDGAGAAPEASAETDGLHRSGRVASRRRTEGSRDRSRAADGPDG